MSINLNYTACEKRLKLTRSKKETFVSGALFYMILFFTKKVDYPFRRPSIDEWYPFYIPCLELSSLLTAVNTLSFKQESITKIECFLNFSYKAIKFICLGHRVPLLFSLINNWNLDNAHSN